MFAVNWIILDQMLFWAAMYKAFMGGGGRGQFLEHILYSRIKGYSNEWGFFFFQYMYDVGHSTKEY